MRYRSISQRIGARITEHVEAWKIRRELKYLWHDWFAWFPVDVGHGESAWLETVKRRRVHSRRDLGYYHVYRPKLLA